MLEFELDNGAAGAVLFIFCKRCAAEFLVEIFCYFLEVILAVLESNLVVVADDVAERCFCDVALHVCQVVEPFVALGGGGGFVCGERHRDFGGYEACVFHDAFRFAGMHAFTVDFERGACGVEVFVGDVAFVAAVNGVGVFCLEIAEVQAVCTASDFFVWREAYPDVAVAGEVFVAAAFGVAVGFDEFFHGGHDFCDSGLVVGSEERRSVGCDERATLEPFERREIIDFQRGPGAFEQNVSTVVVFDDLRLGGNTRKIRRGIHVADEPDGGVVFSLCCCWQQPIDVAVFVHFHLRKSNAFQFFGQIFGEHKLLWRAWTAFARFIRSRGKIDVL